MKNQELETMILPFWSAYLDWNIKGTIEMEKWKEKY